MRKDLIDIVCCPEDKAQLVLVAKQEDDHGDVLEGTLTCKKCHFEYPIEDGIPNLLPPAYHVGKVSSKPAAKKATPSAANAPAKKPAKPAKKAVKKSAKKAAKKAAKKTSKK